MMLTGLETALIGVLCAVVGWVSAWITLSGRYMTRKECGLQHKVLAERNKDFKTIFAMLRAIVLHLPIPETEKQRIINMNSSE